MTYNRPISPKELQNKIRIGFQGLGIVIFSLLLNNKQYSHFLVFAAFYSYFIPITLLCCIRILHNYTCFIWDFTLGWVFWCLCILSNISQNRSQTMYIWHIQYSLNSKSSSNQNRSSIHLVHS